MLMSQRLYFAVRQAEDTNVDSTEIAERYAWLQVFEAKELHNEFRASSSQPQLLDGVTDTRYLKSGQEGGNTLPGRTVFNKSRKIRDNRQSSLGE